MEPTANGSKGDGVELTHEDPLDGRGGTMLLRGRSKGGAQSEEPSGS
jgi:hypothetical protein